MKIIITQTVPRTLNKICAQAARLAFVLAPAEIDARKASMVVPILAPKVRAAASSKAIRPWAAMAMTTAMVALEAWTRMVKTAPATTANAMAIKPMPENRCKKSSTSGEGLGMAAPIKSRPRKIRARPIRAWP